MFVFLSGSQIKIWDDSLVILKFWSLRFIWNLLFGISCMPLFRNLRLFRELDIPLVGVCLVLNIISLTMIYSLTSTIPNDERFWKQVLFTVMGVILFLLTTSADHQRIKGYGWILYVLSCISLVAVLLIGTTIRGTRGWFTLSIFTIQPIEFSKIILALILAHFFTTTLDETLSWKRIGIGLLVLAVPFVLVVMQPDFGSGLILLLLFFGMLLIRGIPWKKILMLLMGISVVGASMWIWMLKPYQHERVLTYLGMKEDPYGIEYNVQQSIVAIGSGGLLGRGLGFGSQSQLRFLPEAATDFIFASTAEELGLVGSMILIGLFLFLFWRILHYMMNARDPFSVFLTLGIGMIFFSHFVINLGTTLGLLPVAGVPLPFVSYGGSFLLTSWIALGLLQSVYRRNKIVH